MKFANLGDLIPRDRDLSKVAIVDLGGERGPRDFTFGELDAAANGVARSLVKRGLARGDRVALLAANRAEYLAAYYGIMRAGLVAVPVNFKFPRETIHFIIRDAGARLVFCDDARTADCPGDLPMVSFCSDDSSLRAERSNPGPHPNPPPQAGGGKGLLRRYAPRNDGADSVWVESALSSEASLLQDAVMAEIGNGAAITCA